MNQTQAFHDRIDDALHNVQLRHNFRSAMSGIIRMPSSHMMFQEYANTYVHIA